MLIVILAVLPVILPGFTVQLPDGRLFNTTLPSAWQVGCVMVPTDGAVGVAGCALITILLDGAEVQPTELVTV